MYFDNFILVARKFIRTVKRHIAFVSLAQTCRSSLSNQDTVTQMEADIKEINFCKLCADSSACDPSNRYWKIAIFGIISTRMILFKLKENSRIGCITSITFNNEKCQPCFLAFEEIRDLLGKQASMETYIEWLDNMVDSHVLQVKHDKLKLKNHKNLLQYSVNNIRKNMF